MKSQIATEILVTLSFAMMSLMCWLMLDLPSLGRSEVILECVAAICSILALFALANAVRLVWRWAMDRPEPLAEWEDIVTLTDVVEEGES